MANTRSASKRARQTQRRSLRNRSALTHLRRLQRNIKAGAEPVKIREMISAIDNAAKRGIIHRNAAIRRKAKLTRALAKK